MKLEMFNKRNILIKPYSFFPYPLIIFIIFFTLFEETKYSKCSEKFQYSGEFISVSKSICLLSYINKNENLTAYPIIKKRTEQRFFIPPCIFSLIKKSCFKYNNIIFIGLNYFFDIPFCLYSRSPPTEQS